MPHHVKTVDCVHSTSAVFKGTRRDLANSKSVRIASFTLMFFLHTTDLEITSIKIRKPLSFPVWSVDETNLIISDPRPLCSAPEIIQWTLLGVMD